MLAAAASAEVGSEVTPSTPEVVGFTGAFAVELCLLALLAATAVAMIRMRRLFGVAMLSGIYSLLSAAFFVALDAVDVAFTEAAVGAGMSTVLLLSGIALTAKVEMPVSRTRTIAPLIIVGVTAAALVYATIDMPGFGDANAPANAYVGRAYIEQTPSDIEVPNVVTAVLASYRGFDTFGETVVVFTAGLACLLLLGAGAIRGGGRNDDGEH
ncbi:MAG: DUF4040 domain-containing protein [Parvularculaceae bacterium]|nr:DUF4040 domain-containing protein [Parvularculaceae bacterium]